MAGWHESGRFAASSKRTWRFYVCWTAAVLLVIVLFFHGTSPQSREYLKNLVGKPEVQIPAEEAFEDPLATEIVDTPVDDKVELPSFEEAASAETSSPASGAAESDKGSEKGPGYDPNKLFFENEVPYDMPKYDVSKLRKLSPHNYKGPGHKAFATFFLSRNDSIHDPYYAATHQVIYRLLWNEESKSHRHPVIVFVPPFVTDEQRSHFEAAGAIVREVAQLPFIPNSETDMPVAHRLKDVFSKLEMWNQTDFTRIAYLDSDAFPLVNIDALLGSEISPNLKCKQHLLKEEDKALVPEGICDYVFSGVHDGVIGSVLNAGVMVLKPNAAMHETLVREYHHQSNFDNGFVEQALLGYVFREDGPFPPTLISNKWNGDPQVKDDGNELYILHAKLWAWLFFDHWAASIFGDTAKSMREFYESDAFLKAREKDHADFVNKPSY